MGSGLVKLVANTFRTARSPIEGVSADKARISSCDCVATKCKSGRSNVDLLLCDGCPLVELSGAISPGRPSYSLMRNPNRAAASRGSIQLRRILK